MVSEQKLDRGSSAIATAKEDAESPSIPASQQVNGLTDVENRAVLDPQEPENFSAFKALGWLDRFLAVWILLAMALGIILGNFVPSTGPALQRGKFVGVSVPIGISSMPSYSVSVYAARHCLPTNALAGPQPLASSS